MFQELEQIIGYVRAIYILNILAHMSTPIYSWFFHSNFKLTFPWDNALYPFLFSIFLAVFLELMIQLVIRGFTFLMLFIEVVLISINIIGLIYFFSFHPIWLNYLATLTIPYIILINKQFCIFLQILFFLFNARVLYFYFLINNSVSLSMISTTRLKGRLTNLVSVAKRLTRTLSNNSISSNLSYNDSIVNFILLFRLFAYIALVFLSGAYFLALLILAGHMDWRGNVIFNYIYSNFDPIIYVMIIIIIVMTLAWVPFVLLGIATIEILIFGVKHKKHLTIQFLKLLSGSIFLFLLSQFITNTRWWYIQYDQNGLISGIINLVLTSILPLVVLYKTITFTKILKLEEIPGQHNLRSTTEYYQSNFN